MAAVASSASWAPSSPRLSFSRDFVQSEVFSPSPSSLVDASQDFDFGMLALLRMGDPDAASPMLPADELFSNGRLIAKDLPAEKSPGAVVMAVATTAKKQVQKPEQRRDPPHASQSSPITSSRRWGELFGGGHRAPRSSSASMSELEQPLAAASAMASASSSSSSSVSSSAIKCTKLKLLFRSSSAGGGLSRRRPSEPCLGRSASESKASCCSCCTARSPLPVVGPTNAPAPVSSASSSASRVLPSHKQPVRRRTLSEMSYQKLGQTTSAPRRPSGKKADAWKAYTNSTDRVVSASSSASSSSSGTKVAQVLHMDICMGQSVVVSKVAKAFTKKDNRSL